MADVLVRELFRNSEKYADQDRSRRDPDQPWIE